MSREEIEELKDFWFGQHAEALGFNKDTMPKLTSRQLPFYIANFIKEWGAEDAKGIIEQFYEFPYEGRYQGEVLGEQIFYSQYRTLQAQLCSEWHMRVDNEEE